MFWGTVLEHMSDTVIIGWDDEPEFYENWDGKECRYRVDRGQMRFRPRQTCAIGQFAPKSAACGSIHLKSTARHAAGLGR